MRILDQSDGISFSVRVHPRARKNAITGVLGDALKLSLTTPPIDGKANQACIEFLAKFLKVPRSSVTIASGQSSRTKMIRVIGISAEEFRKRVGIILTGEIMETETTAAAGVRGTSKNRTREPL